MKELIRVEGSWNITDSCSIDGSKYVSAIEERQTPIEAPSAWTGQVAEGEIIGVRSGYGVEIVHAEIDRAGHVVRANIGRGVRRVTGGTIPRAIVRTNIRQAVKLRKEKPVRAAVNEASAESLAGQIGGEAVRQI